MITVVAGFSGFALGLYAGRKRAKNYSWRDIVIDFLNDSESIVRSVLKRIYELFRSGGQGPYSGSLSMS